jgi:hypothetical protein
VYDEILNGTPSPGRRWAMGEIRVRHKKCGYAYVIFLYQESSFELGDITQILVFNSQHVSSFFLSELNRKRGGTGFGLIAENFHNGT